jgi:type IV pilus assembly protein PilM
MANARFAWGIDIGNRALKAIKLVRSDNGLRVDDFEVIEHENVLSSAGDNKEALIQSALASFVQRHPVKGGVAAISVSGVSSFARFIKLPPVEPKKIPEIVRFEAIQQIPFPLDDVEWSYQLFQQPDSPEVEVGIFAMRRDLINHHIQHFTDVKLNVQVVQMNPLAVYNAMYYDSRIKGTTMIIDLGAENTDLIIAEGESIWLRSIPIGGNNFTDVLVKSFKLPFGKAEELKRNANTSKYARQIFQAMRPVFADLVAEIQRSIGFYSSVHRESRIKKVIALGGTFRLAGLQKYLQQNLQLDVEKLNSMAAGAPADAKMATTFNENILSLVSAYGLAIQAMGEAKITSSLLPLHIRRERMWQDKTKWFGAAAAAFLLGSGLAAGGYYLQDSQFKLAQSSRDQIQAIVSRADGWSNSWSSDVESAGGSDRQRITNIRSMLGGRNYWPSILETIASALPAPPASPAAGPRGSRNIILLDKMSSVYTPDLLQSITTGQLGPGIAVVPNDPLNPPAGRRGFIVSLNVTTPHQDAYPWMIGTLVKSLSSMNQAWMDQYNAQHPDAPVHFYIARVYNPIGQQQFKDDPGRIQAMQTSYAASMQEINGTTVAPTVQVQQNSDDSDEAPRPGMRPNGPAGAPDPSLLDRVTGEDRSLDWEMKLVLLVCIDPPPATPAAAAGQ